MNDFNIELAKKLVDSEEQFPVDLDLVSYKWVILK